eukprot:s391_g10.t1
MAAPADLPDLGTAEGRKAAIEKLDTDFHGLMERKGVSGLLQATLSNAGVKSIGIKHKAEAEAVSSAMPPPLNKTEAQELKTRFEQVHYKLEDRVAPAAGTLEFLFEQVDSGEFKTMALVQFMSREASETEPLGATIDRSGMVKIKKGCGESKPPRSNEELRELMNENHEMTEALDLAMRDTTVKERYFLTPAALDAAAEHAHPPSRKPSAAAEQGSSVGIPMGETEVPGSYVGPLVKEGCNCDVKISLAKRSNDESFRTTGTDVYPPRLDEGIATAVIKHITDQMASSAHVSEDGDNTQAEKKEEEQEPMVEDDHGRTQEEEGSREARSSA